MTSTRSGKKDISVVIPVFNCAEFIGETLESVFAQTLLPAEVIVVDDGSTDNLEHAVRAWRDRIRLVRQKNGGSATARNTGIREARFDLIQFVDGDDVLMPTALEEQVRCMEDAGADVVYGDCVFWGSCFDGKRFTELYPSTGRVTLDAVLSRRCNVVYAVLAKREALLETGLFDPRMRLCEDMDLWVRMLKRGFRFAFHRGVLLRYRRQGQNKTSQQLRNLVWEVVMYARFFSLCPGSVRLVIAWRLFCLLRNYVIVAAKQLAPQWLRVRLRRQAA